MNEEIEEAQIIEVEQETPLGDDQSAEISLESPEDSNAIQSNALSEEDLDKRREKTQKRINKLVAQRKESEEREAAAMQFAQQQKSEVDVLRGQLSNLNTGYSSEATSRIDSQEVQAKTAFKEAYEAGEVDKMADAQQVMAKIAIEKERLRIFKDNQEKQKASAVQMQQQQAQMQQQQMQQPQTQQEAQPDFKATEWAEREENKWFGEDRAMTATAFSIHQQLVEEEGLDPQSDEYYEQIDTRIRQDFPHKFNGQSGRSQKVASVSQGRASQKSKKSVKLSPAQISVAKKLGVPLEAYAREVAKLAARDS